METFLGKIYNSLILQRAKIVGIFKIMYGVLTTFVVLMIVYHRYNDNPLIFFYQMGNIFGKISLITYVLTLIPGIAERMIIKNKAISIMRIYRRYLGILMYLLAIVHVTLVKWIFISTVDDLLPQGNFEVMGMLTASILLLLFITSNTMSLIKLKIWWYRIHRLIYLTMFFVFFHVALIQLSIWTILIAIVIILQLTSFILVYKRTRSLTGGKPV